MVLLFSVIIILFIGYILFFTDKAKYDINSDYIYYFKDAVVSQVILSEKKFSFQDPKYEKGSTFLVEVKSGFLGYLIDPKISFFTEEKEVHYIFERGGCGKRYVDISMLFCGSSLAKGSIQYKACSMAVKARLFAFNSQFTTADKYLDTHPGHQVCSAAMCEAITLVSDKSKSILSYVVHQAMAAKIPHGEYECLRKFIRPNEIFFHTKP